MLRFWSDAGHGEGQRNRVLAIGRESIAFFDLALNRFARHAQREAFLGGAVGAAEGDCETTLRAWADVELDEGV